MWFRREQFMSRLLWSHIWTWSIYIIPYLYLAFPLFLEYLPRTSEILLFLKTLFKHQLFVSARLPTPPAPPIPLLCSTPPSSPQRILPLIGSPSTLAPTENSAFITLVMANQMHLSSYRCDQTGRAHSIHLCLPGIESQTAGVQ